LVGWCFVFSFGGVSGGGFGPLAGEDLRKKNQSRRAFSICYAVSFLGVSKITIFEHKPDPRAENWGSPILELGRQAISLFRRSPQRHEGRKFSQAIGLVHRTPGR